MALAELLTLFEGETAQFSLELYFFVFLSTLALGFFISWCYRSFSYTVFYSKTFNLTLCYLPFVVAVIILSVKSDLAISLGILGALSIVRYRTPVKEPLDLFFILWAVAEGVALGAGLFFLAVLSSLVLGLFLKLGGGGLLQSFWEPKSYIVIFRFTPNASFPLSELTRRLSPYVRSLREKHLVQEDSQVEVGLELVPKKGVDLVEILKKVPSEKTLVISPEGNVISY